jgi:hypothetical protein
MSFTLKSQRRFSGHIQLRDTTCVCVRTRRIDSYVKSHECIPFVPRVSDLTLHLGQPGAKTARAIDVNFSNHRRRKFPPWTKEGVRKGWKMSGQ